MPQLEAPYGPSPLPWRRGPWPVEALQRRHIDGSPAALLGRITARYGRVPSWPTALLVSRASYTVLCAEWKWVRELPRDGFYLRNNRCDICGWLTRNPSLDKNLCDECSYNAICKECVHASGHRWLCDLCLPIEELSSARLLMHHIRTEAGNAYDCFCRAGPHFSAGRSAGSTVQSYFLAWRRAGQEATHGTQPDPPGLGIFFYVAVVL